MVTSIELQVISCILTSDETSVVDTLCGLDSTYYSTFKPQAEFIFSHRDKYGKVPDIFTFQAEFPDITLVRVSEPVTFLVNELNKNKQYLLFLDTFNTLKELGSGDVTEAWQYLNEQCEAASKLDSTRPIDLVKDADIRAQQLVEFGKQARIPTGFDEIDKLMYGGLSTVEEFLVIVARTNTGKSWIAARMMESAQRHKFPVLFFSPEMQSAFLGTRFDTWRNHFRNSDLARGDYTDQYKEYLKSLKMEDTSAYILEDRDAPGGEVTVDLLRTLVKRYKIKLLIVDGLSYLADKKSNKAINDSVKYKNLCTDLFRLSKQLGCAVVAMMQANRETKNNKDEKGEGFPTLYEVESSDHPARIATQVFSVRQVFEQHVLDIRLEKSRNARNAKAVCSYSWEINTGDMRYLPGDSNDNVQSAITPIVPINTSNTPDTLLDDEDDDMDVEF